VISITSCQPNSTHVIDGAAILGHSIDLSSQQSKNYKEYARYAFVYAPAASTCIPILETLGWKTIVKDKLPVEQDQIQDFKLRQAVAVRGCCGVAEFMKLFAYTLVEHPIVVHLDTDVVILKTMEELFDTMLGQRMTLPPYHWMQNISLPPTQGADFYFTRDYHQASKATNDTSQYGVQGGFFVVKPNLTMYKELTERLVQKETYTIRKGWSGQGHTGYWGASQIQGYLSYVYKHHYPGRAVELNRVRIVKIANCDYQLWFPSGRCRHSHEIFLSPSCQCIYNSMINDPPRHETTGACLTGQEICEDCRLTDINTIYTIHMTLCRKPFECPFLRKPTHPVLCQDAHRAWFLVRKHLEQEVWSQSVPTGGWNFHWTLGYCRSYRTRKYLPLDIPNLHVGANDSDRLKSLSDTDRLKSWSDSPKKYYAKLP